MLLTPKEFVMYVTIDAFIILSRCGSSVFGAGTPCHTSGSSPDIETPSLFDPSRTWRIRTCKTSCVKSLDNLINAKKKNHKLDLQRNLWTFLQWKCSERSSHQGEEFSCLAIKIPLTQCFVATKSKLKVFTDSLSKLSASIEAFTNWSCQLHQVAWFHIVSRCSCANL